jgi:PPOX class probable F420-dependent enzyme
MQLAPDEAWRRFAEAAVARLATVRADGAPHIVPVVFAADGDRIVMAVDPKPKRSRELLRLRNIASNPAVSLLVDHYEADWRALWWVRADGQARIVEPGRERDEVVDRLIEKYAQYVELPGAFGDAVIVNVTAWSSWSAT